MKPSEVGQLLSRLEIRPRKYLGQNFLIDRNVRGAHVRAAAISAQDVVLEIGPGLGALTELLVSRAGALIAIEKDPRLYAYLRSRYATTENLSLLNADMLDLDVDEILSGRVGGENQAVTKVVANLPYASGSRMLVNLIRAAQPPAGMFVTVQLEVAARLCAEPGGAAYGMLSCWAQRLYTVRKLRRISPACFFPAPEVTSAIVAFERREDHGLSGDAEKIFYELTKFVFTQRRKQLVSSLGRGDGRMQYGREALEAFLQAQGLSPKSRPEQLQIAHWCELARHIADGQLR